MPPSGPITETTISKISSTTQSHAIMAKMSVSYILVKWKVLFLVKVILGVEDCVFVWMWEGRDRERCDGSKDSVTLVARLGLYPGRETDSVQGMEADFPRGEAGRPQTPRTALFAMQLKAIRSFIPENNWAHPAWFLLFEVISTSTVVG